MFVGLFITFLVLYLNHRNSEVPTRRHVSSLKAQVNEVVEPKFDVLSIKEADELSPPLHPSPTNPKPITDRKYSTPHNLSELAAQARANFVLSRYAYSREKLDKTPLISIVTRTHGRPVQLERNVISCHQMIDTDFEHVILHDRVGAGMQVAETALYEFRDEFEGEYICHLDDDDWLSNFSFVTEMRKAIEALDHPKIIIFKVWHAPVQGEMPLVWKKFPGEGQITTSNVLIRKDLYTDSANISAVARHHAGDYTFIHNVLLDCQRTEIGWVNETFFYISADRARAQPFEAPEEYVTVKLQGGLGNQMFQVAAAYGYAQDYGKTLILDHTPRVISQGADVERPSYFKNTFHWTTHDRKIRSWNTYREPEFAYHPPPEEYHANLELVGYFQSPQYFNRYRDFLVQKFTEKKVCALAVTSGQGPTISVHFRRSDYVGHSFHTNQPNSYYVNAVKAIRKKLKIEAVAEVEKVEKVEKVQLVIFSDDITWCQGHLPDVFGVDSVLHYVEPGAFTDEQEMYLMAQCDHHVIANSSFSWWGAYLDTKESALTVAPSQWFNDSSMNWQSIYCQDWIKL